MRRIVAILAICLLASSCGSGSSGTGNRTVILVSAAASLQDSVELIAQQYEQVHPEVDIQFNYGSSGTLQQQIEQGAPADLFLSAGKKQMESLIKAKLVRESRDALANRLVLIVGSDFAGALNNPDSLLQLQFHKVAIGQPESVPAGSYAKQSLTRLGLWDKLLPKLVYAKDVRQVLTYVETGNADAGLVYRTDAMVSGDKVRVALELAPDSHDLIVYPFGLLTAAKQPEAASAFYRYLLSDRTMKIFENKGFLHP